MRAKIPKTQLSTFSLLTNGLLLFSSSPRFPDSDGSNPDLSSEGWVQHIRAGPFLSGWIGASSSADRGRGTD